MSLIGLLVLLIIVGLVIWATRKLIAAFGIGEPIGTVIYVLVVLVLVLYVVSAFGILPRGVNLRL